jgi:hypothetical protein
MGRTVTGSQLVLKFLILAQKGSFANIIANSNKKKDALYSMNYSD